MVQNVTIMTVESLFVSPRRLDNERREGENWNRVKALILFNDFYILPIAPQLSMLIGFKLLPL